MEVLAAADEVEHAGFERLPGFEAERIEQQAVHGEVAAQHVFPRRARVAHLRGATAIRVADVMAVGSHLGCRAYGPSLFENEDDPEVRAYGFRLRKVALHEIGSGVGGNIPILRLGPEQQIAHAAAGEDRLMAVLAQDVRGGERGFIVRVGEARHQ